MCSIGLVKYWPQPMAAQIHRGWKILDYTVNTHPSGFLNFSTIHDKKTLRYPPQCI
jgi:hypothetical protein